MRFTGSARFTSYILNRASQNQMPTSANKVNKVAGVSRHTGKRKGLRRIECKPQGKAISCYSGLSVTRRCDFSNEARKFVFI